jgi:hypothetical protein
MNEIPNINANPIANLQINANGVPQIGINNGPRIIPTIDSTSHSTDTTISYY